VALGLIPALLVFCFKKFKGNKTIIDWVWGMSKEQYHGNVAVLPEESILKELKRLKSSLLKYAFSMHGIRRYQAEELYHEAFIRLHKANRKATIRPAKIESYIHTIYKNLCIDYIRKEERRKTFSFPDLESPDFEIKYSESPQSILLEKEERELVNKGISQLSGKYERVIRDIFFDEVERSEIAEKEGISKNTVVWRITQAKKLLKRKLYYLGVEAI